MRRTSAFHNLVLIRLLTFVSVIGAQIQVLSAFATVTHIDDSNTTAVSSGPKTPTVSFSSPTFPSTLPTFDPSSSEINPSGTSKVINSNSNNSTHPSTSMTSQGSSTAATLSNIKNTSKFPIDYSSVKNQWAFTDGVLGHGALFPSGSTAAEVERPRTFRNKHHHEHHWGPFFEEPLNSSSSGENLVSTAHLFTEAVLNCRVGMLKDKTVMWVRRTTEKVSLLTVGNVTYSGDPRIRVKYQYPNNWRLLINPTQKEDAGVYMCQVSTHPPRVFTTNLTILEPPLRLIDDQEHEVSDRYYKSGSTIDLQCQVSISFVLKEKLSIIKSLQPQLNQNKNVSNAKTAGASKALGTRINELVSNASQPVKMGQFERQYNNFILWSKDGGELPSKAFKRSSSNDKWLTNRISIPEAKISDSGNYSCSIGKLFRAIVFVQVLTGELPAAVQHNSAQSTHLHLHPFLTHLPCICFLVAFKVLSRNISPFIGKGPSTLKILL